MFAWPGAPRNVYEKLQDASVVHRFTGVCPSVALHIPWDEVDDWQGLVQYAYSLGIHIGAINPNLFQDDDFRARKHRLQESLQTLYSNLGECRLLIEYKFF